jgi:histidyl-tRNA synthetase
MAVKYQSVKGFPDLLPPETRLWEKVEQEARALFTTYGFQEIRLPVLEYTELFSRGIGPDTDIVEKEMFSFPDKKGRSLTLRPEATASVVRAYIEQNMGRTGPVKLYYLGPMFRYERPQKGRHRQFWQIGAEAIGLDGPAVDAELISMLKALFDKLEISGLNLEINSLGCPVCRPRYREKLIKYLKLHKAELCPDCKRRLNENPLRVLDCKNESCKDAIADAPGTGDFLCNACKAHFSGLKRYLNVLDVPYKVNPRIVRGLDYYTRTVFEYQDPGQPGAQNTVVGGGRYDDLIEELGGPRTPACGFALGMERLIKRIPDSVWPKTEERILIVAMGEKAFDQGLIWTKDLREAGFITELAEESGSLKKQLKIANRMNMNYVFIIGEDEIEKGVITIRDMSSSEQKQCQADEFKKEILKGEKRNLSELIKKIHLHGL